eukprot:3788263-Amphidinium_carterae.1
MQSSHQWPFIEASLVHHQCSAVQFLAQSWVHNPRSPEASEDIHIKRLTVLILDLHQSAWGAPSSNESAGQGEERAKLVSRGLGLSLWGVCI